MAIGALHSSESRRGSPLISDGSSKQGVTGRVSQQKRYVIANQSRLEVLKGSYLLIAIQHSHLWVFSQMGWLRATSPSLPSLPAPKGAWCKTARRSTDQTRLSQATRVQPSPAQRLHGFAIAAPLPEAIREAWAGALVLIRNKSQLLTSCICQSHHVFGESVQVMIWQNSCSKGCGSSDLAFSFQD
jgi:hypothetical protein